MDSFFFNITDTSYKVSSLSEDKNELIKRVDISIHVQIIQLANSLPIINPLQ